MVVKEREMGDLAEVKEATVLLGLLPEGRIKRKQETKSARKIDQGKGIANRQRKRYMNETYELPRREATKSCESEVKSASGKVDGLADESLRKPPGARRPVSSFSSAKE